MDLKTRAADFVYAHAHCPHDVHRGPTIMAVEKVTNVSGAFGNRTEDHRPMADGLIPRDPAPADEGTLHC